MIRFAKAPPYCTVQDVGRPGFRASGVPPSGAADRESLLALNFVLGNEPGAAALEWALAGGTIQLETDAVVAWCGCDAMVLAGGQPLPQGVIRPVSAGTELRVERILRGRFLYLSVRGGIDVPLVLGSRSTLVSAGLGGHEGRRMKTGDTLRIGSQLAAGVTDVRDKIARAIDASGDAYPVTRGPHADLFGSDAWGSFLTTPFTVSAASDRAGYRLDGLTLDHGGAAALPSEPTCVGAVQIPGGGTPIVLMNDGPTIGGYPAIAVIRSTAMSRFAQTVAGDRVRFALEE